MIKHVFILFLCFFLTGCTTNGFIFRSWGGYDKSADATAHAVYKIGAPYIVNGISYTPSEDYDYVEVGVAGWYVPSKSKLTYNGEVADPDLLTANHKTLPLPSMVRVTNLENKKSVVVRVNDRGPFVNNRIIDVSQRAAEELDFPFQETTLVRVEILPKESKELKEKLGGAPVPDETRIETKPVATKTTVEVAELEPIYQPDDVFLNPIYTPDAPKIDGSKVQPETDAEPASISEKSGTNYYIQHAAMKNKENADKMVEKLNAVYPAHILENGALYKIRTGPFDTREKANSTLDKFRARGYGESIIITDK